MSWRKTRGEAFSLSQRKDSFDSDSGNRFNIISASNYISKYSTRLPMEREVDFFPNLNYHYRQSLENKKNLSRIENGNKLRYELDRKHEISSKLHEPPQPAASNTVHEVKEGQQESLVRDSVENNQRNYKTMGNNDHNIGTKDHEYQQKAEDLKTKIKDLQSIKNSLITLIDSCSGSGPKGDCPILNALEREQK